VFVEAAVVVFEAALDVVEAHDVVAVDETVLADVVQ
jgi:hypothetical protein